MNISSLIYAIVSVISRQIYLIGLLLFFTYGLSFNNSKYISLVVIGLIFIIQLVVIVGIWAKRLKSLGNSLNYFS